MKTLSSELLTTHSKQNTAMQQNQGSKFFLRQKMQLTKHKKCYILQR